MESLKQNYGRDIAPAQREDRLDKWESLACQYRGDLNVITSVHTDIIQRLKDQYLNHDGELFSSGPASLMPQILEGNLQDIMMKTRFSLYAFMQKSAKSINGYMLDSLKGDAAKTTAYEQILYVADKFGANSPDLEGKIRDAGLEYHEAAPYIRDGIVWKQARSTTAEFGDYGPLTARGRIMPGATTMEINNTKNYVQDDVRAQGVLTAVSGREALMAIKCGLDGYVLEDAMACIKAHEIDTPKYDEILQAASSPEVREAIHLCVCATMNAQFRWESWLQEGPDPEPD